MPPLLLLALLLPLALALPQTEYTGFHNADLKGTVTFFVGRPPQRSPSAAAASSSSPPSPPSGGWSPFHDTQSALGRRGFSQMAATRDGFRFLNVASQVAVDCKHGSVGKTSADDLRVTMHCARDRSFHVAASAPRFALAKAGEGLRKPKPFYIMPLSPTFWAPASGSYLASTGWFGHPSYAYNNAGFWGCDSMHAAGGGGSCAHPHGPFASSLGAGVQPGAGVAPHP